MTYATSHSLAFGYDARQRLISMSDAVGTTAFACDVVGFPVAEDGPWVSDGLYFGEWSSSSALRIRVGVRAAQPNSSHIWVTIESPDTARRIWEVTSAFGYFDYTFSGASPVPRKITTPSGAYITNTFDGAMRLTGTYLKDSGNNTLNSHTYGYNVASLRTNMTLTAGNVWSYTNDNANQLKTAFGSESGGASRAHEQFSYIYDAAGNLTTRTNNALTETFTPNTLNQLTSVGRSGTLTVSGTTTTNATSVTVNSTNAASRYSDASFAAVGFCPSSGNNTYTAVATDSLSRSDTNSITVNLTTPASFTYDGNGNMTSGASMATI